MTSHDNDLQHTEILHSLRAITTEISALRRAGIEIDEGQLLAILDLVESGLQQILHKLDPDQTKH